MVKIPAMPQRQTRWVSCSSKHGVGVLSIGSGVLAHLKDLRQVTAICQQIRPATGGVSPLFNCGQYKTLQHRRPIIVILDVHGNNETHLLLG